MLVAFTPIYVKLIGIESYGLVGFFVTLQTVLSIFDFGISLSVNRFIAQLRGEQPDQQSAEFLHTLKVIYWFLAFLLACVLFFGASWMAGHWVRIERLSPQSVIAAVKLMGLSIGLQFPFIFYSAGILGLQRHVRFNILTILISAFRAGGAFLVLKFFSPTIVAFFAWQAITNILQTTAGAWTFRSIWRPKVEKLRFRPRLLQGTWRFAAGITGVTATGILLLQMDKLVISKMLSLETFGYYTLAAMLSSGLSFVAHPFYATLYPRFSQLVSLGDEESQKALYHRSTQLLVSIILPVAMVFAFFARQVLFLWTQNATIAQKAHWLLTFTMLGNLLNCLLFIPNVLQFSHGWTRLALLQNTVVLIALFPLQVILTTHFGPIGPPVLWFAVNVVWLITSIHLMHRRILKNEEKHWYIEDVGPQFLAVLTIVALSYFALSGFTSRWAQLISVCLVFCLSVITAAATSPFLRSFFLTSFRNYRNAERQ